MLSHCNKSRITILPSINIHTIREDNVFEMGPHSHTATNQETLLCPQWVAVQYQGICGSGTVRRRMCPLTPLLKGSLFIDVWFKRIRFKPYSIGTYPM